MGDADPCGEGACSSSSAQRSQALVRPFRSRAQASSLTTEELQGSRPLIKHRPRFFNICATDLVVRIDTQLLERRDTERIDFAKGVVGVLVTVQRGDLYEVDIIEL